MGSRFEYLLDIPIFFNKFDSLLVSLSSEEQNRNKIQMIAQINLYLSVGIERALSFKQFCR